MKINNSDLGEILNIHRLNTAGNNYICDCPICGKSDHFYISIYTQKWDCKKCGESGGIYKLLRFLDKTYLIQEGATVHKTELIRKIDDNEEEDISIEIPDIPKRSLPVGWKVDIKNSYLKNERSLSMFEINYYDIGTTNLLNKYKNYIIFPVYENQECKGFVGRYGAKKVPKDLLRYRNNDGFDSSLLLYGYDDIVKNKTITVILVEGIFDKISVDRFLDLRDGAEVKCVCTFGKKISDVQIAKLLKKNVKNIILLYDFDAIKEIKKTGIKLDKYFFTTITYTMNKDIDECDEDEATRVFSSLIRPSDFNLNVVGKIKK